MAYNLRFDVGAAGIERGVVVGDETDGRSLLFAVARQGGIDVTHVVHLDVLQSLTFQFLLQVFGKDELFRGTRHGGGVLSRLRIKLGVIDKPFY